jgi:peptidoglycan/LPS O-acetylase OafA/YrhL
MKIGKLESIRGFAAIYVMLSHLFSNHLHLQRSWIGQPFRFAQEGVLLFFLLSGFVIYYSWHEFAGTKDFKTFFFKRFKRIYPLFLLSLLLAYFIGASTFTLFGLLGNLAMTQGFDADLGWKSAPFMGNEPLWSLSYEWWFYMMFFPLYCFVSPGRQIAIVFALALAGIVGELIAPNILFHILASFPIWWCGVEFAREFVETKRFTWQRQWPVISMLAIAALAYVGVAAAWVHGGGTLHVIEYPVVKLRHYVVALVLIVLFFAWKQVGFKGFDYTFGPFKMFAGISYAIYVLHYPIICYLPQLGPTYLDAILKVPLVLALAWLAEGVFQKHVSRWMDGLGNYFLKITTNAKITTSITT